jgi:hypothetical protein
MRRLPDFIIAGARKCGTTWLHERLSSYPEFFFPPATKEVFFFDRYWDRGLSWYEDYFRNCPDNVICGEASPTYFATEPAAKRIHKTLPHAKMLFIFRDPVSRALSHYQHLVAKGDTRSPFETAIKEFPEILNEGFYFRHLIRFVNLFGADRIHVLILEDIVAGASMDRTFDYLGATSVAHPSGEMERVYGRRTPRAHGLAKVATKISRSLHHIGLHSTVAAMKKFGAERLVYNDRSVRVQIGSQMRMHLNWTFKEDVENLGRYLNRDLTEMWKLETCTAHEKMEMTAR